MVEKDENKNQMENYEVIVSETKGKFICRIPELYLVAKGHNLESCHRELMQKKDTLVREVEEFEGADEFDPPSTTWFRDGKGIRSSSSGNDFEVFLKKTGVVSLLFLIVFYIATQTISGKIEDLSKKVRTESYVFAEKMRTEIKKTIPSKPGRKIESELYKAVDHPIDPEREKKIAASLRVIVNRLKPFAKEFRPLLEEIGLAKERD